MPAAILRDKCLGFFRSPTAARVRERSRMMLEHGIDERPGSLHGILTGKEHAVAGHGIFQKPLVGQSLSAFFFDHGELFLVPNKFFPFSLHPPGKRDEGMRGKLETYIVCSI